MATPGFAGESGGRDWRFRGDRDKGILRSREMGPDGMEHGQTEGNGKVKELSREEGRKLLDEETRRYLKMDAEEFIQRWDAGGFGDPDDRTENPPEVMRLGMLVPFVR